ncbi:MAG: DoxX family protein [Pseudomonadota bacterium]|nr:DoxX family protein [Pseudomonadota bacterium]
MNLQQRLTSNAHWFLRAGIVSVFLYHGILKLMNLQGFADMLPISYAEVLLVALAEVGGSLLIILGGFGNDRVSDALTRVGAFLNLPVMIGAVAMVHWGRWNFLPSESHPAGGMEFQVVLGLIMLYIVFTGNKGIGPVGSRLTGPAECA